MFHRFLRHLVVCISQIFPNNKHFPFKIASVPENLVPLLAVEESDDYGSAPGAAPLSHPVSHLDVSSVDWDADFVAEYLCVLCVLASCWLVSMCCDTFQALMFSQVSVCCDIAKAWCSCCMSIKYDTAQGLVFAGVNELRHCQKASCSC